MGWIRFIKLVVEVKNLESIFKLLTGDNSHISGGMAEIILPKDSGNLFSRERFAHFISRRSLSIGLNFLRMDLKNNSGRVRGILKSANV